ncbi:CDP-diacylglycerol--glycerol-3-phosphate 3-phosphatidyltransferase [Limnobacter thiooxidans]|uniref:CDP-diacylglycerol--glycerol-3-phosphate 3-phosphatidyltransferase n=1 Tax=Limnobacter thiooxidans TaxID=131080 RepID=A0AA86JKQ1_9BURK|nr:CDP-diacylglycerol--glycerol-3-phosphate 3-phosphatidyltransferase [Limnobacter thiooxidans]BET26317.1 CDP-diacylglycerol--glycerol-3-phosphate 3-phosphatidyltransferase [Limnobacter thiooxidans]
MPLNLPMILTWVRIVLIPLVVGIYFLPETVMSISMQNWVGAWVFIFAAITDAVDGYLARRWNQTSAFGAFLDPVADKLMVGAALIVLVDLGRIGPFLALIIIGREITISALREWMASIGARNSVAVNWLGKFKTIAQMVAIPMLLVNEVWMGIDFHVLGTLAIYVAAVLTVWSMCYYLMKAWPDIRDRS